MGLERLAAILQHVHSNYEIDIFDALIKAAAREPLDAVALIYAMLLSPDETMRITQLAELARRASAVAHRSGKLRGKLTANE